MAHQILLKNVHAPQNKTRAICIFCKKKTKYGLYKNLYCDKYYNQTKFVCNDCNEK